MKVFNWKEKSNRKQFLLTSISSFIFAFISYLGMFQSILFSNMILASLVLTLSAIALLISLFVFFVIFLQRLRDINYPLWILPISIVIYPTFPIFFIFLSFKKSFVLKSTKEQNDL